MFDARQRLTHFNQAYVELWQLDAEWLETHPRDGEILDRLRQDRRLPEKADYRDWKKSWLASYGLNAQIEDQWHLPDGRTLHVIADSEGAGGVTYLYENVTERIGLESRYNALIQVAAGDARVADSRRNAQVTPSAPSLSAMTCGAAGRRGDAIGPRFGHSNRDDASQLFFQSR